MLLVVAGVVAAAYGVLGASLLQQRMSQDALLSRIDSAEAVLGTADEVRDGLRSLPARLETAKRELAVAQAEFPAGLDGNHILRSILALAGESGIRVLSVSALVPDVEPAGEPAGEAGAVTVLKFKIEVDGEFGQVTAFLGALEDQGAGAATRTSAFALRPFEGRHALRLDLVARARSP